MAGSTVCTSCAAGSYTDTAGTAACIDCDGGKFASENGVVSCAVCNAGEYSAPGAAACDTCAAGSYSSTGAAVCQLAPAGYFTDKPGSSEPDQCPEGYTSFVGSTSCANCLPGMYYDFKLEDCANCPMSDETDPPTKSATCLGGEYLPIPEAGYWVDRSDLTLAGYPNECPSKRANPEDNRCGVADVDALTDEEKGCFTFENFTKPHCAGDEDEPDVQCNGNSEGLFCDECFDGEREPAVELFTLLAFGNATRNLNPSSLKPSSNKLFSSLGNFT